MSNGVFEINRSKYKLLKKNCFLDLATVIWCLNNIIRDNTINMTATGWYLGTATGHNNKKLVTSKTNRWWVYWKREEKYDKKIWQKKAVLSAILLCDYLKPRPSPLGSFLFIVPAKALTLRCNNILLPLF